MPPIAPRHLASMLAGLVLIGVTGTAATQPAPPQPEDPRAFLIQTADGRTTQQVVGRVKNGSWAPNFPLVAGADSSREGLPLSTVQFEHVVDGRALNTTIALLYGNPHQLRIPVVTVRVTEGRPVRIAELEAYGLKPITLSLAPLPSPQLALPPIISSSSHLEIQAELEAGSAPAYRFSVANRSGQAVMALAYELFFAESGKGLGRARKPGRVPLIAPGETYVLRIAPQPKSGGGTASTAWRALQRLAITTVMWSDGLIEGDPAPAADEAVFHAGSAVQLSRALALIRGRARAPASYPIATLRADIAGLGIDVTETEAGGVRAALGDAPMRIQETPFGSTRLGMQQVKNAILNDIDAYKSDAAAGKAEPYAVWLPWLVSKYDGWQRRIAAGPR
jgi:hypothetical protein